MAANYFMIRERDTVELHGLKMWKRSFLDVSCITMIWLLLSRRT